MSKPPACPAIHALAAFCWLYHWRAGMAYVDSVTYAGHSHRWPDQRVAVLHKEVVMVPIILKEGREALLGETCDACP